MKYLLTSPPLLTVYPDFPEVKASRATSTQLKAIMEHAGGISSDYPFLLSSTDNNGSSLVYHKLRATSVIACYGATGWIECIK